MLAASPSPAMVPGLGARSLARGPARPGL